MTKQLFSYQWCTYISATGCSCTRLHAASCWGKGVSYFGGDSFCVTRNQRDYVVVLWCAYVCKIFFALDSNALAMPPTQHEYWHFHHFPKFHCMSTWGAIYWWCFCIKQRSLEFRILLLLTLTLLKAPSQKRWTELCSRMLQHQFAKFRGNPSKFGLTGFLMMGAVNLSRRLCNPWNFSSLQLPVENWSFRTFFLGVHRTGSLESIAVYIDLIWVRASQGWGLAHGFYVRVIAAPLSMYREPLRCWRPKFLPQHTSSIRGHTFQFSGRCSRP